MKSRKNHRLEHLLAEKWTGPYAVLLITYTTYTSFYKTCRGKAVDPPHSNEKGPIRREKSSNNTLPLATEPWLKTAVAVTNTNHVMQHYPKVTCSYVVHRAFPGPITVCGTGLILDNTF